MLNLTILDPLKFNALDVKERDVLLVSVHRRTILAIREGYTTEDEDEDEGEKK